MSLHEDLIFSDPVLQRVFFDPRRFAPMQGREADVNLLLSRITEREVAFHKARSIEALERLMLGQVIRVKWRRTAADIEAEPVEAEPVDAETPRPKYRNIRLPGMRELYFQIRELCDGYYLDYLGALLDDGCMHIALFEHGKHDAVFRPQYDARFHLWQKYARRRPVNQPGCRWF